jgi:CRP/FNR family transcriptional regulator
MLDTNILGLIQRYFPNLVEKALQEEIATVSKVVEFAEGTVIMDVGQYVKLVPLVLEGLIKVSREDEDGHELFLYYLQAGQTCSMSFTCCMMNKKSEIRTVAEENTRMIGIPIHYVDQWMSKYQSWKNFIMQTYDSRMLELIHTIDSIAFRHMDERLLEYLHKKALAINAKVIQTTHQEIAYDLNASREAVSRLLKQLENDGKVKLGRNKIEMQ